jgi:hypothetical protein
LDWRGSFLQATCIWGALVVVFLETLSIFRAISPSWLALLWGVALVFVLAMGVRRGTFREAWNAIRRFHWHSIRWVEWSIICGLAGVVSFLLVIALVAVPNTTDSLLYHLSRAVHWAQNQDLEHYPTQYEHQILNPIWAELAILNLRVLWGSDKLANLVQWFSMLSSLIGVSVIVKHMGAERREQLLAAAFVVSIPMGVLQATSTQNDYVATFWLVCLAYFVVLSKRKELDPFAWLCLGLAVGLGLLTKGTFYVFVVPFLLWLFVPRLLQQNRKKAVIKVLGISGLAVLMNLGFWVRNLITYGGALGPSRWVAGRMDFSLNPLVWISTITKSIAQNLLSTIPKVNIRILNIVEWVHGLMGVNVGQFPPPVLWNHEDLAGSPLHTFLIVWTLVVLLWLLRRTRQDAVFRYTLVLLASMLLFVAVIPYSDSNIRFLLTFFVAWGVVYAVTAFLSNLNHLSYFAAFLLIFSVFPWLLLNRSRPVIGLHPHTMLKESIFRERPAATLFANWFHLRKPYLEVTNVVDRTDCRQLGLKIDSSHLEYPYWWLLDAPQSGMRIETVDPPPHLARYADPTFDPCAVICSICDERSSFPGLVDVGEFGAGIRLYLAPYMPSVEGR